MSGFPKPRSITSRPSRRNSRFSASTVAKTYGGSSWMRRNSIDQSLRRRLRRRPQEVRALPASPSALPTRSAGNTVHDLGRPAMPVEVLRCHVCESEYPATASGICMRCFGPLEPVYDWDELARTVSRETIEDGPQSLWRYAQLLPA